MSRRPSVHVFNMEDEDDNVNTPFISRSSPPRPSTTRTTSEFDSSNEKASAKLPQKPAARRTSNAPLWNKPTVDWTRTRGTSSSFSLGGLFGGGKSSTYSPMTPMDPTTGYNGSSDEKSHIELDMDEDLRLGGDPDEKTLRRRTSSAVASFFDQFSNTPQRKFKIQRSRRAAERIGIITIVTTLFIFFLTKHTHTKGGFVEKAKIKALGRPNPLKSNIPLHSYKANLKPGAGYVTTFPYGGLTNQLIEMLKVVHVAQRLDRTAILTDLAAVHSEGGDRPLDEFFDMKSFAYYSNASVVSWNDVKLVDTIGTQREKLSCWGARDQGETEPLSRYNIETNFWPYPEEYRVQSSIENSITFPNIELLELNDQTPWLTQFAQSTFGSIDSAPPFPDPNLLCLENTFYVPNIQTSEGTPDYTHSIEELSHEGPIWEEVGRHLRFNKHINHLTDELLIALLGSNRKKFIAVHLRQGDFIDLGRTSKTAEEVAERFKAGVEKVQKMVKGRQGKKKAQDLPVLFATDSTDPLFIKKLNKLGWIYINHVEFATSARFGGWYPGVLDSSILSRAVGFVGTRQSTFSYVAARRVESWNGGKTLIVG
ncbi:O-fucosyltransferase family protein [Sporobolomyces salmoneus]|uniref:O-fucosyltransferase family protein n=1 Tax=Sporobolomyces salmoneus TaxID=183962 RepID=UPI00317E3450